MLNKYDYMHIRTSTYFLSSLEDKDIKDDNGIAVGVLSTVCTYKHILHTILPLFTVWKCNIVQGKILTGETLLNWGQEL